MKNSLKMSFFLTIVDIKSIYQQHQKNINSDPDGLDFYDKDLKTKLDSQFDTLKDILDKAKEKPKIYHDIIDEIKDIIQNPHAIFVLNHFEELKDELMMRHEIQLNEALLIKALEKPNLKIQTFLPKHDLYDPENTYGYFDHDDENPIEFFQSEDFKDDIINLYEKSLESKKPEHDFDFLFNQYLDNIGFFGEQRAADDIFEKINKTLLLNNYNQLNQEYGFIVITDDEDFQEYAKEALGLIIKENNSTPKRLYEDILKAHIESKEKLKEGHDPKKAKP